MLTLRSALNVIFSTALPRSPVVVVLEGEAAEKLFDAVRLLSAVPEFSEFKRSRNPF
jgi:hypothetical protein